MNPNRFFMPVYTGISNNLMTPPPMMRMVSSVSGNPVGKIANLSSTARGTGLFGKITGSIRAINWGGLLNNANKTLNVMNQAIPLIRQAGPMVSNMKSMMKIAKVFGNETNNSRNNNKSNVQMINSQNNLRNNNISINTNNKKNNINLNNETSINVKDKNSINQCDNNFFNGIDNDNYYFNDLDLKKEIQNSNSPNFFI